MPSRLPPDPPSPFAQLPGGLFILTSQFENQRDAILAKWVQQCSDRPPMMMVALSKGQPIEAILQNSRAFALCQISADDRFLTRKFAVDKNSEDPLVSMLTHTAPTGSPIVDRAMTVLDCRIVRHVELDSDYRIYVGEVIYSALLNHAAPAICLGGNGFLQSD